MSDRTAIQVIVYDCPEGQRAAALEVLRRNEMAHEWADSYIQRESVLEIGDIYGDSETSMMAQAFAAELTEAAPGSSFVVWNDPKYEWDGAKVIYTPDLGARYSNSNAAGESHWALQELRPLVEAGDLEAILDLLGLPWEDAINALRRGMELEGMSSSVATVKT